jgi:hypothetical protein
VTLEALTVKAVEDSALRRLYAGWGFKTLLAELAQTSPKGQDLFTETDAEGSPKTKAIRPSDGRITDEKMKVGVDKQHTF